MKQILMTGATTLAGAHLFAALAKQPEFTRIHVLLHPETRSREVDRLRDFAGPCCAQVNFLPGDLRFPQFGLSNSDWDLLTRDVELAFDCSESAKPEVKPDQARQNYVGAARGWTELLASNQHLQLSYLSTAFIAGRRRGLFTEFDLDCRQSFHTAWERCRWEAELLLRKSPVSPRVTVFRSSLVVGDSHNGSAFSFGGFYPVLKFLRRSNSRIVVGDFQTCLDIVPVNFVADAVIRLIDKQREPGGTFHLVAGWQNSIPLHRLVHKVVSHNRQRFRIPYIVPPVAANLLSPLLPEMSRYSGILKHPASFDMFRSRSLLPNLCCPPVGSYLGKVIDYAEARNWA